MGYTYKIVSNEKELRFKYNLLTKLSAEFQEHQNRLDFTLDQVDMDMLLRLTKEKRDQIREVQNESNTSKLAQLGILEPVDSKYVNKSRRGIDKIETVELADPIFNLSSRILTDIEKRVLNKGLKYGIKSKKIDTFEILARFEELAESLNYLPIAEKNDALRANLNSKSNFFRQLQVMADEFIGLSKEAYDNLSDEEREAIVELSKDKSIVISKADKGNAVVIQNTKDYKRKVSEILSGSGKFVRLKENVTRLRETRLQGLLRSLHAKTREHRIPDDVYRKILPCGSRAGVLYGLPKIHKAGAPIRPIISAVKTYNYGLAKYLDEILKPLVDSEFILKDTYDFVNKIGNLDLNNDRYLVSFDVESLFTNVPTIETINIILDLAFKDGVTIFHELTREELKQLLTICTRESHFQFNGEYFDQVDGVAMGSPLGPLFANIFMSNFERKHMSALRELGVKQWLRYVDDVFASLGSREQADTILAFLNEQHPNIRFTIEHEECDRLPFLDTCVVRRVNKYSTTIYRKKTFTGVYLNWTSLTARRYKISLIRCLAERIWRICSEEKERHAELAKLKIILERNEYPADVIDRSLSKFLENKARQVIAPEPEKPVKRFLKLPYVNRKCEDYAHRLKQLVKNNYPQVEFNVAFQAPMTIGKFFPFKDNIKNVEERSLVVYSLKCVQCGIEYIGKTERILCHRLKEHKNNKTSACKQHVEANPTHHFNFDNVEILDTADSDNKLRIKELLHILSRRPELNKQLGLQSAYEIKTLIISAYPQFRSEK